MNKKSVYCTAPWNGLTVREDGRVLTCCVGRKVLVDLKIDDVNTIEQSTVLQEIRNTMLTGKPDVENCSNCIKQEKNDGFSTLRNHFNKFYPDFDSNCIIPKYLDLRWNNTCNLACMYCGPHFSNTWNTKLKQNSSAWNNNLKQNNLKPVKPYQDELLSWVLDRASHVKEIALVGGEPLLMKQNYELLKLLPLDCQISIITNLSYDLKNLPCLPDLLKRPADNIKWTISAENTHQQFEYVRQGANWAQFEDNIKFLRQHWENSITLNMVYSIFNAFELLEIVKTYKFLGIQKFNLLPVDANDSINVSFMPTPIRLLAKKILDQVIEFHVNSLHPEDKDLYPILGFKQIMMHLEQGSGQTIDLEDFQKQINWYDQWSSIPFKDLWPNVTAITKQYLI